MVWRSPAVGPNVSHDPVWNNDGSTWRAPAVVVGDVQLAVPWLVVVGGVAARWLPVAVHPATRTNTVALRAKRDDLPPHVDA
jgi:hypothetical protein